MKTFKHDYICINGIPIIPGMVVHRRSHSNISYILNIIEGCSKYQPSNNKKCWRGMCHSNGMHFLTSKGEGKCFFGEDGTSFWEEVPHIRKGV